MTIDNMGGRAAAMLLAGVLAAGGTSLLFGDVIFGHADFTQKHFQTITIVIATTVAWMVCTSAAKNRHGLACLGFLLLALAGSAVIVWNSLGRQTEGTMLASDAYDQIVTQRAELNAALARDQAAIADKQVLADKECASGEGPRCRSARATVAFYKESAAGYEARIARLAAPKPVDPSAEAFANLAAMVGYNGPKAKAIGMLVMPYVITLLFEFGFTMSLHYAFRPRSLIAASDSAPQRRPDAASVLADVSDAELSTLRGHLDPDGPEIFREPTKESHGPRDGGIRTVRKPDASLPPVGGGLSKQQVLDYVLNELDAGRTVPSQQALAGLSGVRKQRVSEWVREWEAAGLVPARTQQGRCKALAN